MVDLRGRERGYKGSRDPEDSVWKGSLDNVVDAGRSTWVFIGLDDSDNSNMMRGCLWKSVGFNPPGPALAVYG